MLLTITTTHRPATDLGFLLHKHPARLHSRPQTHGVAHVFFAEAGEARCTAVLFVEVDPVGLVRGRSGSGGSAGLMDQYVNDRPYAASSLLSAALSDAFRSALAGSCAERPELVGQAIALEFALPILPCRGGETLLRALFEPLGYQVEARLLPLDERFPGWGDSLYFSVVLRTTAVLAVALSHLYVLIPVLDNRKHYWIGEAEVHKLLGRGEPWLATHPQRDLIVQRYLKHRRQLTELAIERLIAAGEDAQDGDADEGGADASGAGDEAVVRGDAQEQGLERRLSLNELRLRSVCAVVERLGASSVIDLGCGEGRLLRHLLPLRQLSRVTGMDVSLRSLEIARERLRLDQLPDLLRDKLTLLHGSLVYRDERLAGHDVATLVEVVEHLDAARLGMFTRVVFEVARPRAVVVTTPNREYNVRFPSLRQGGLRHPDHRFEWSRAEFRAWAAGQAGRYGYSVTFEDIGEPDAELGAPTQMAIFERQRPGAH